MTKHRRIRKSEPEANGRRLLRILEQNLSTATDEEFRRRLQAAIRTLQEKQKAA
jgi:hypothetical protein